MNAAPIVRVMAMSDAAIELVRGWRRLDKAWLAALAIPLGLAVLAPDALWPVLAFAARAFVSTLGFIVFAVLAIGTLKATGAENLLARAFEGNEVRMIVLAALIGGLSPFCSCEVIPFIAALLAAGAPLSAVMAFWLSSPIMDPAMFVITMGTLGLPFALAKAASAVGMGLLGGFTLKAVGRSRLFDNPLKAAAPGRCNTGCDTGACCGDSGSDAFSGQVEWRFWRSSARRRLFGESVRENALFLGKWLLLAYLIEALMVRYVPAELVAGLVGGTGLGPILMGALVGAPAYLNGYAAVPLVGGLMDQGMSNGAAMAFILAGGVSSIPAALAVWALVRPRVFVAYLVLALIGAVAAGLAWDALAPLLHGRAIAAGQVR